MEHYKISNLLNDLTMSSFVTEKWIEVNDLLNSKFQHYKYLLNLHKHEIASLFFLFLIAFVSSINVYVFSFHYIKD